MNRYRAVVHTSRIDTSSGHDVQIADQQAHFACPVAAEQWLEERCRVTGKPGSLYHLREEVIRRYDAEGGVA